MYKQCHSTETALLKVHSDVSLIMSLTIDKGKVTALALLDLSAALDNIDHNVLIKCLSMWHGISDTALSWFSSYLIDRYQRMKIANCFSLAQPTSVFLRVLFLDHYFLPFTLLHSVQLFKLTTWTNSSMQMIHNLPFLGYSGYNCSLKLRDCLQNVFHGTTNSKLKLNANNTEFLIIGTQKQHVKLDCFFPTPFHTGHLSMEFRSDL